MFRYVSNAGLVFQVGAKKVGIDCLCRDSAKLYQDTPLEIRQKMELDVLIFTHEHEDHFCAEYVKEAWERNPKLQIYSTQKVIECLAQMDIPTSSRNQVQDGAILEIDDMQVQFIETLHEGGQYANAQNLTLLIKIGDKHFVVSGDAMPCKEWFERISAGAKQIDWLFVPFPYVGLCSTRKLMKEYLDIKNIFALHQPRREADVQNWIANTKRLCDSAKDGLPYPIFPEKPGEWYCL